MNRLAGAVLFGLSLIAMVMAVAFQRFSTYLPVKQGGGYFPNGAPAVDFPLWGWGLIGVGFVIGLVLMIDVGWDRRKNG